MSIVKLEIEFLKRMAQVVGRYDGGRNDWVKPFIRCFIDCIKAYSGEVFGVSWVIIP